MTSHATSQADSVGYVEIDGDQYPADRVGPDGRPLGITQEQADAIARILECEWETNPLFREQVLAAHEAMRKTAEEPVPTEARERGLALVLAEAQQVHETGGAPGFPRAPLIRESVSQSSSAYSLPLSGEQ